MLVTRKSKDRGQFNHGWLQTAHTFSFGEYQDEHFMGFRALRVINEDHVIGGEGFPFHDHQNMEILTYILAGELEHKDSMGNGEIIRPGDMQYMSAGTGVTHSEFNPSKTAPVHLMQIWVLPEKKGLPPAYGQTHFSKESRTQTLKLVASRDGRDGSLKLRQDLSLYASLLGAGKSLNYELPVERFGWLQLASGALKINGTELKAGDGVAITKESKLEIAATADSEFLFFDLA